MAKTLLIMRHAKSSWDDVNLQDWERPLIENGVKKTQKILNYIKENNVVIDLIMSSHAVRAHDTACLIAGAIGINTENIFINNNIYDSDTDALLSEVYAFPNNTDNILIVGHNPTFTQLANRFLDKKVDYMPTSGLISITFHTHEWETIETASRTVNFVAFPKKLK